MTANADESILAAFGKFIAPVFAPLGFGNWVASVSVLSGIAAKEMIISTMSVLTSTFDGGVFLGPEKKRRYHGARTDFYPAFGLRLHPVCAPGIALYGSAGDHEKRAGKLENFWLCHFVPNGYCLSDLHAGLPDWKLVYLIYLRP